MTDGFPVSAEEKLASQLDVNVTNMDESTAADEVLVREEENELGDMEGIFKLDFTDAEIRCFVKAYMKFGSPRDRLRAIVRDSGLVNKSMADLKRLGELIHTSCVVKVQAQEEYFKENPSPEATSDPHRVFNIKISGVEVNSKSIVQREEKLEPLHKAIPSNRVKRDKFQLTCQVDIVQFDTDWNQQDDTNLLLAIYKHGYGNWDLIKRDTDCKLLDKILPDDPCKKPQSKDLQARASYLLKLLKKQQSSRQNKEDSVKKIKVLLDDKQGNNTGSPRSDNPCEVSKMKKKKPLLAKESGVIMDEHHITSPQRLEFETTKNPLVKKESVVLKDEQETHIVKGRVAGNPPEEGKVKDDEIDKSSNGIIQKKKDIRNKTSEKMPKATDPVHIPAAGSKQDDLDPESFTLCKEYMKPVKKYLRLLGKPMQGLSDQRLVQHWQDCLLKVGDRIKEKISSDPEHAKMWWTNLWKFVSKFTHFGAERLSRSYKTAQLKRRKPEGASESVAPPAKIPKRVGPVRPEPSSPIQGSTGSTQLLTSQSTAHPIDARKSRDPSSVDERDRQSDQSNRSQTREDRHPYDPPGYRDRRSRESYRHNSSPQSSGYGPRPYRRYSPQRSYGSNHYRDRSPHRPHYRNGSPQSHDYRSGLYYNSPLMSPPYQQHSSRGFRSPPRHYEYFGYSWANPGPYQQGYPYPISSGYHDSLRRTPYDRYSNDRTHTMHPHVEGRRPYGFRSSNYRGGRDRSPTREFRSSNYHRGRDRSPTHESRSSNLHQDRRSDESRSSNLHQGRRSESRSSSHHQDRRSDESRSSSHHRDRRSDESRSSNLHRDRRSDESRSSNLHRDRRSDESCSSNHHRDRRSDESRSSNHHKERVRSSNHHQDKNRSPARDLGRLPEHKLPGPALSEHATPPHRAPQHGTPEHTKEDNNTVVTSSHRNNISPRKRTGDQYSDDRKRSDRRSPAARGLETMHAQGPPEPATPQHSTPEHIGTVLTSSSPRKRPRDQHEDEIHPEAKRTCSEEHVQVLA